MKFGSDPIKQEEVMGKAVGFLFHMVRKEKCRLLIVMIASAVDFQTRI